MKKDKDPDVIIRKILDKMLEPHGLTIQNIMDMPKTDLVKAEPGKPALYRPVTLINGVQWFQHFTHTQQQHDAWKNWSIEYMRKETIIRKGRIEREFDMLNLMYGLRIVN